ncbi:MAG: glycoside hydrolase family 36 protein [Spirochaetota bacterium]
MRQGWKGRLRYKTEEKGAVKSLDITENGPDANADVRVRREWTEGGGVSILSLRLEPLRVVKLQNAYIERWIPKDQVDCVHMNGFQSWTESREWAHDEGMHGLRGIFFPWIHKYHLDNYGDYSFTRYRPERIHGYSWFYFRNAEELLFLGSLSERLGYTRFYWYRQRSVLRIERECEGLEIKAPVQLLQLLIARGEEAEVFDAYFKTLKVESRAPLLSGWTSWYRHYSAVTADIVLDNLRAFQELRIPIQVFQIDDGWERAIGDWLEPDASFEGRLQSLAAEITAAGYTPGLWIAPFIVEETSNIFREHPQWCVADENGRPRKLGYNPFQWQGNFYALNIYLPAVREYLREVFHRVIHEWGYRFLKLDFLYAAARVPFAGRSRGMIMNDAMDFLYTLSDDAVTLGCGVPLASAAGRTHYCRIGADVAPKWEDRSLQLLGYRERVSTVNSLRSTIGRRALNRRAFVNDPDVYILRKDRHELSSEEQYTLFVVNRVYGGLLFTSDNPGEYSCEQLKLYLSQFPLRTVDLQRADQQKVFFKIDEREYVLFHNLENNPVEHRLEPGLYYSAMHGFRGGGAIKIPPHAARCFLRVSRDAYAVAGSTDMLLPGSEIVDFNVTKDGIEYAVHPETVNPGLIYLKVPSHVKSCKVNGVRIQAEEKVDINLLVLQRL